jgi:radical SAM superfamily enzyme YgiQ (UPF0313 family)
MSGKNNMKFTMIFPPLGHGGSKSMSIPLAPPVLEHVAGLIAHYKPSWDLTLINANKQDFDPHTHVADVVGITILTHQAFWAYGTADILRARGIKVLLGGPHVSVMREEAAPHSDALLVGEAESFMEQLLNDIEHEALKPLYEGELLSLEGLPNPRRDLLKGYQFRGFATSRGCPFSCKFCDTPRMHGTKVRYRPIGDVIADISSHKHKMWFSTDADIWGPDVPRYIDLFNAMASELDIYWLGEGSISSMQHERGDELMRAARKSGLVQIWVGLESFVQETLVEYGATAKMRDKREEALKRIRDNGIDLVVSLMFGGKGEQMDEYSRVLEMIDKLNITPHPVMVVPYPGTAMREELRDDLLYGENWDYYDGLHSTIKHEGKGRDNATRDRALVDLWVKSYTWGRIMRRALAIPFKGFPSAHMSSMMVQVALRNAFGQYARLMDSK